MSDFLTSIEGADVTVVLGSGVAALVGHVESVGSDYLRLVDKAGFVHHVPVAAVVYVRYENE